MKNLDKIEKVILEESGITYIKDDKEHFITNSILNALMTKPQIMLSGKLLLTNEELSQTVLEKAEDLT